MACGLENVVRLIEQFRVSKSDVRYLGRITGADGKEMFPGQFLEFLSDLKFNCDVDAIPEGSIVFPNEPLLRITGPIIECQLLETAFLNFINFETLVATKAARLSLATGGEPVIEFGLRRAQGTDGGVTASRAAFVGGCAGTSNVLAGKMYGIPIKGTHAHSWVMAFENELEAFEAYAEALPNNCVFLVDTYNTLKGVENAVKVGKGLLAKGHKLLGIRLDSGDLAYLSIEARKILDASGFEDAVILASNDLDENVIVSLKAQGAKIDLWGVGTRLVTAYDQPALGGVYKLSAIREPGGDWEPKLKLSEQAVKVSTPGIQQVRRFERNGEYIGDVIYDEALHGPKEFVAVDPFDFTRRKTMPADAQGKDLLVPIFRKGKRVYELPSVFEVQSRARRELGKIHAGIKRFVNPHEYRVGLEQSLHELKTKLILKARGLE